MLDPLCGLLGIGLYIYIYMPCPSAEKSPAFGVWKYRVYYFISIYIIIYILYIFIYSIYTYYIHNYIIYIHIIYISAYINTCVPPYPSYTVQSSPLHQDAILLLSGDTIHHLS